MELSVLRFDCAVKFENGVAFIKRVVPGKPSTKRTKDCET